MTRKVSAALAAPPVSDREIICTTEGLIRQFQQAVGSDRLYRGGLWFDDVYNDVIYPDYGIEIVENAALGFDVHGKKILGQFDVERNQVLIDGVLYIRA